MESWKESFGLWWNLELRLSSIANYSVCFWIRRSVGVSARSRGRMQRFAFEDRGRNSSVKSRVRAVVLEVDFMQEGLLEVYGGLVSLREHTTG